MAPERLDPVRRRLLRDLALGTAAFTLVGCVEQSTAELPEDLPGGEGPAPDPGTPPDAGPLVTEYTMEHLAAFAYAAAAPLLESAEVIAVATSFREHHLRHQEHAERELRALGVPLPSLPETYALPDLADEVDVLRYALTLETQAVSAYIGVIAQMTDLERRRTAASILGSEVTHVAVFRMVLGHPRPFDFAFATDIPLPDKDPELPRR